MTNRDGSDDLLEQWEQIRAPIRARYREAIDQVHHYFPHFPKTAKQVLIGYAEVLRQHRSIYPNVETLVRLPDSVTKERFASAIDIVSKTLSLNKFSDDSLSDARGLLDFLRMYGEGKKTRIDDCGVSYNPSKRGPQLLNKAKVGAFVLSYLCRQLSLGHLTWSTESRAHYYVLASRRRHGPIGEPKWPLVACIVNAALGADCTEESVKSDAHDVEGRLPLVTVHTRNAVLFADDPEDPHEILFEMASGDPAAALEYVLKQTDDRAIGFLLGIWLDIFADTKITRGGSSFSEDGENSPPDTN